MVFSHKFDVICRSIYETKRCSFTVGRRLVLREDRFDATRTVLPMPKFLHVI